MLRCNPKMESWGLLALRVAVGIVFIYQGYGKLFDHPEMTIGMFTGLGFPLPMFWAYFVGAAEVVGGLMVLLGVFARIAGSWLAIIMIVAMLTAHRSGPFTGFFMPIVLLGSCLALMGVGAGEYRLVRAECVCPKCLAAGKEGTCNDKMEGAMADGCCGAGMKGACCGGGGMKKEEIMKK